MTKKQIDIVNLQMYDIKVSLITIGDTDEQEYAHQLLYVSV